MTTIANPIADLFDAWHAGDLDAITAAMESFADPDRPEPVRGPALREQLAAFLDAFPRPRFQVTGMLESGGHGAVFWELTVTHRGAYRGIAPTGAEVHLTGVDEYRTSGGRLCVTRYFDRTALCAQLDEARVAAAAGFEFGTSERLTGGRPGVPGAMTLTRVSVRDGAESAKVDQLTAEILKAVKPSKGFLGGFTVGVGTDKYTVSAFTDTDAVRAVHNRAHQRAMRRFFTGGLCTGSLVSVWTPVSSTEYLRCAGCAAVRRHSADEPGCACGEQPSTRPVI